MIVKLVMCLIMFFTIGGIFLLGRFDPEEENEAVVNEKK